MNKRRGWRRAIVTFFDKNKFNMACNETIEIIMHMEDEMKEKIPQKLITFLNKNKIRDYKPSIDFSKNILEEMWPKLDVKATLPLLKNSIINIKGL